jgi:hypothetical protein
MTHQKPLPPTTHPEQDASVFRGNESSASRTQAVVPAPGPGPRGQRETGHLRLGRVELPLPDESTGLTKEERNALFARVRREEQKVRMRRQGYLTLMTLSCLAIPLPYLLIFIPAPDGGTGGHLLPFMLPWLLLCSVLSLSAPVAVQLWYNRGIKKSALNQLADLQDVRFAGYLINLLAFPEATVRAIASRGLVELLPRMKASDGALLSAQHRETLRLMLKGRDYPLMLAILRAYPQIGDESDLEAVGMLLANDSHGELAIRWAAQNCLPFLQAKAEQRQNRDSLLRASDQPNAPAELLRPAAATETNETQQLLRPTNR